MKFQSFKLIVSYLHEESERCEPKQSACNKHTLQELQFFLSKNHNISNFILIRVNGWIIWGAFPLKNEQISHPS